MYEIGKCNEEDSDDEIFVKLYGYFMNKLVLSFQENDNLKQCLTLIGNETNHENNLYWNERPQPNTEQCVISGVLNAGKFGNNRILSDFSKKDNSIPLNRKQPVLQYYYVFCYFPLDHHEGIFLVHTDSAGDSVSSIMRDYVRQLFKCDGVYGDPRIYVYAPASIQEDLKKESVVESLCFKRREKNTFIENAQPFKDFIDEYDVEVKIKPKKKGVKSSMTEYLVNYFRSSSITMNGVEKFLKDFRCFVNVKNKETGNSKTYDWSDRDYEFKPVIYLKDKVFFNDDGTANLAALNKYCWQLFEDLILPDVRPDLYAV
jgi:hypothetical protein